ncbi:MAG: MFS transporter, partial [Ruminococcaceae bacterium]|nr:MFS transporter [Oscillospiraceae bacterium]
TVGFENKILASTIALISVLWDAVTDPIIGYYADKASSDKRKYMLRAIFPMAICFVAAFVPLGGMKEIGKFVFYIAMTMLFWLFYTVYTIPYYAVVAEITEDYDERTSIRGLSSLLNTIAIAGGNIIPSILPLALVGIVGSAAMGWFTTAIIVSVIAIIFGLLAVLSLRNVKLLKADGKKIAEERRGAGDIFKTYAEIIKLKPFIAFVVFIFFFLAGSSMLQANIVYMIKDCIGVDYDKYVAVFIVGLVVTMAAVIPIVTKVAEKTDRRFTCIVFFSIAFAGLLVSKIYGLRRGSIPMLVTQPVFMGIAGGAFWTVFYSMAYDLVEIDEFVTGKRRESVITSFPQFVQKFGAAIGMWTIGWVLQLTDYDKDLAVQKANTVNGIENLSTLFPALLLGISIIGLIFYPVTKERFQKLTVQLEKKRNGEEYNTEGFEKLL